MVRGGLQEGNVSQVVGFADTIRLNPSNPNDPLNRRISITVQNKTAGGLPSAKPAGPSPAPAALEKGQAPAKAAPAAAARPTAAGQPAAAAPAQAAGAAPASSDQSGRTPVLVLPPRPQLGPAAAGAPPKK